ncbi:protein CHLOROPLAST VESICULATION [Syzygium oleosum]|uniref:protein CHLOROPLAST VESICULATION n=1 Tax=Syzygium oleosum TaxID=219896 RepID=UPI0011D27F1B|nr:protein CHLOROPLAST VESICULATION [Syzygium oleosum]
MAMAAACCLSPSPPTPRSSNPSSSSTSSTSSMAPRTVQVAWGRNEQAQPGRRPGAARVAMMVIGLVGMGSSFVGLGEVTEAAMASESLGTAAQQKGKVATIARWSEKRSCPPWQLNSLETIVPENLPRPYGHRKSESVGLSDHQDAPALKARAAKSNPRCFSM